MSGIDLRTVLLVARKELLEAARDRRTLFVALLLPVLLYPLMMLVVGPLVGKQRVKIAERAQKVVVTGPGRAVVLEAVLPASEPDESDRNRDADKAPRPALDVVEAPDPATALGSGDVALWIEAPGDAAAALRGEGSLPLVAHFDSSDDESRAAWRKWQTLAQEAADRIVVERLDRRGLPATLLRPITIDEERDIASKEQRGGYAFGKILALILVLMTLTSSFYPAVDMVAGEKERGTMETLLVAPCRRSELVLGKYLAVLAVTLVAALLNLVSMWLTLGPLVSASGMGNVPAISLGPASVAGILALLVPMSALFSALSIGLSTLARSVKEAQHYLTPMFLFVMPLAMVVVIPSIELSPTLAAVPITGIVLFFRDLLVGKLEWALAAIVFATTVSVAALALWWTVRLFLREETLFRGPEGSAPLLARPLPRRVPGRAAALGLFGASLALIWYLQPLLPSEDLRSNVMVTQLVVVLLPCVLFAWWLRVDRRETLRLRAPTGLVAALSIPIGLTLPVVNGALSRAVVGEPSLEGPFHALAEAFERMIESTSPIVLVGLLGVLPAVCEEIVYRGFVLSGLGSGRDGRGRPRLGAVFGTAALFALFHVYPEKWVGTFLPGVVLGLIAVAGRSLFPAILAHALNNASLVLSAKSGEDSLLRTLHDTEAAGHTTWLAVSAAVLAVSLALLWRPLRRALDGPVDDGAANAAADAASRPAAGPTE